MLYWRLNTEIVSHVSKNEEINDFGQDALKLFYRMYQ